MNPLKIISAAWMNRVSSYDQSYYTKNHLFYRRSLLLPFTKAYYRYLASYAMAGAVKLEKGAKVLDIGCGVGSLVEQFNHLDYDCVGVDVNPQAIKNSVYPQKCYLVDTSAKLKYQPGYFDLIVSREVLEHIPADEIDECIEEWDRVSKGKMVHIIAVSERGPSATDDPVHVNVRSEQWWIEKFSRHHYRAIKNPRQFFFSQFGRSGYLMFSKT